MFGIGPHIYVQRRWDTYAAMYIYYIYPAGMPFSIEGIARPQNGKYVEIKGTI